ncbi:hypothetical protein KIW84_034036 [Lathyrus oleraceus]|uniref:CCHC-type domain-containing protein n=1 Tax=Pisum sativum TaxID=3888 RepID=A0A9D4Y084_PEA|nr:hypothetical protein KIW84_034036 [Pisum sativum]
MGIGRSFNKATIECYNCHKLGHFQYEFPNGNNGAHFAEIEEKDEVLLMAYVELQESIKLEWENDYEDVENAEEAEEAEEDIDVVPSPNDSPTVETIATTGRVRKPPFWSADYVTGEGLSDTEEEANMARVEIENLAFMVEMLPYCYGMQHHKASIIRLSNLQKHRNYSGKDIPFLVPMDS